ncbi:MAG: response regulator [Nitrosopumilaceae archaeon]|nr:response regulator [Nitrosopumilaceae archaeon]
MSHESDILIVEDSPAVTMLLKGFLEKIGYDKIHACSTGESALQTFRDLNSEKKIPVVLLDFRLPDMDADTLLSEFLKLNSNARIILETATDEDDPGVKNLIRKGAYEYIQKPIRFEKLKEIFETLEKEQQFFEKESKQIEELEKATEQATNKIKEQIDFLFKTHNQISLLMIQDVLGFSDEEIENHIKSLEEQKQIVKLQDKKEIACNQCGSVKKSQIFFCPSCKSSNFKLAKIIEHHPCGNIAEEKEYTDDKCPSCGEELKALGVDYRIMKNHYICNNCKEVFAKISTHYLCLNCENRFTLEEANWKTSPVYKSVNI